MNTSSIYRNYIAGDWVAATHARPNINPSDLSDVIGEYALGSAADVERAAAAAVAAAPVWRRVSPYERFEILDRVGSELVARKDEIGRLLAREEGKTLAEGVNEASRAGALFKYFAVEGLHAHGERMASARPGVNIDVMREPLGVVGIITPWNFPISIPAWKIAPALAFGNCVLFKPAELVPGCAWILTEILSRSGLPPGVFNLLMGQGQTIGKAIVDSTLINGVSFTGSVPVGRGIAVDCIRRGARVQLELGGKNPLLVLDDADLDVAVAAAIQGSYHSTGQRCTASSRLIVSKGLHDQFVDAMVRKLKQLRVGNALDPATEMGPVVSKPQLESDLEYLEAGQSGGATLLCGGERLEREREGYYLSPALFVDSDNRMRINREEIFGPVAAVIRVDDYEHGLAIANDTEFGLCAGIVSSDHATIADFKLRIQAGMVTVNASTAGLDFHAPFTGRKGSSFGPPERAHFARDFYTAAKVIYSA